MTKQTGNVLKVIELGVQDRVYEAMKQTKFSVEALTRDLNKEDIKITAQSIRKFIKNTKEAQKELIARDLNAANELKKITMDYGKELKNILTEVQEVKDEARVNNDMATYNQLVGRIMQGIELVAKLTGDIKPSGSTNIDLKIIYNEINDDIEKKMRDIKGNIFTGETIDVDAIIVEDDKEQTEILNEGETM